MKSAVLQSARQSMPQICFSFSFFDRRSRVVVVYCPHVGQSYGVF